MQIEYDECYQSEAAAVTGGIGWERERKGEDGRRLSGRKGLVSERRTQESCDRRMRVN
jgi:hypothetical protein